jgi:hypothetical protein
VISDRLVVVLMSTGRNNVVVSATSRCGRTTAMEWTLPAGSFTVDIALFKEKVYVLTADLDKYERELLVQHARDGRIRSVCCIGNLPRDDNMCEEDDLNLQYIQRDYLVVSPAISC